MLHGINSSLHERNFNLSVGVIFLRDLKIPILDEIVYFMALMWLLNFKFESMFIARYFNTLTCFRDSLLMWNLDFGHHICHDLSWPISKLLISWLIYWLIDWFYLHKRETRKSWKFLKTLESETLVKDWYVPTSINSHFGTLRLNLFVPKYYF